MLLCNVVLQDVVAATCALEELKSSKKFGQILELVLLMGNYMNSGSHNAQSVGFEISYLTKVNLPQNTLYSTLFLNCFKH